LLVITHAQAPADILRAKVIPANELQHCEELGATLAAGLAMGLY
jgi:glycerol kinase